MLNKKINFIKSVAVKLDTAHLMQLNLWQLCQNKKITFIVFKHIKIWILLSNPFYCRSS